MKYLVKFVLVLLLIPTIIIFLVSSTFKFQILSPNYWKDALKRGRVYANLSKDIKTYTENQTIKGGGKISDLKDITDIITPAIVEDFVSHNLDNFLGFANGKKKEIIVYLPINKIPKEFTPKSVSLNTDSISLISLASKFNIDISAVPISQIALLGMFTNLLFFGSLSIVIIFLMFLYKLSDDGKRFLSISIPFILTGFIFIVISKIVDLIKLDNRIVIRAIVPFVLHEISNTWFWVGCILVGFGIILLVVKKNESRQI
jgi:hypothetical protein